MPQQKSIYIAVLNQGNIRTELVTVLNELSHQQDRYKLFITYPSHKPISYNRNKIVQDFLTTECDFLMMVDSDIIPPSNILNLADFNEDIVAPLMFAYQEKTVIPLILKQETDGLWGVQNFKGNEGLIEVDATGTGCIIIKREVLEKIKWPFRNEYDADGIKKYGLDLMFCQRAKKEGFKVYCHLDYPCSHWITMDLKDVYLALNFLENQVRVTQK